MCPSQNVPGHPSRAVQIHGTIHSLFDIPGFDGLLPSRSEKSHTSRNKSRVSSTTADEAGVIEGEVHFMMVPWSNAVDSERVKFKIMGVNTC